MDKIKMDRDELLEKLVANRAKHKDEFEAGLKIWKKKATKALKKAATKAEKKGWIEIYPLSALPKPENYLSSYDDAIARVEADIRPELELDDREFSAWVQDNWNWRGAFAMNTQSYTSSAR